MMFEFSIIASWPNMKVSVKPDLVTIIEDHWFGSPYGVVSRIKIATGEIYLSEESQATLARRLNKLLKRQK